MSSKDPEKHSSSGVRVNIEEVRLLVDFFKETDLSELEYEAGGSRIRLSRQQIGAHTYTVPIHGSAVPHSSTLAPQPSAENHPGVVRSPMVGTVYLSPKPGDPSFVSVGSSVSEGQTLMIIEAMKVMNPFKSPKSGTVTHILVEDGYPVEYDEPLLIIE